jgi:RNA polymerase sigma factor (sigma-70 family)
VESFDEAQLMHLIGHGDRQAFDEFYRRTSPWLAVRLRRRCADLDIVADVLQDTYVAVWRAAAAQAGSCDGSTLSWLWTIAAHRLVDAFRRRSRLERTVPAAADESLAPAAEEIALATHVSGEMERALLGLPLELRAVLRAMVLDGLSVRETSILLGVPEGTVKTRARRARTALREALS